jgi:serine/threonine protein kinase
VDTRFTLPTNLVLDAGYRIVRVVGRGGFGITYEAEDLSLGTNVALKEYYPAEYGDRDASMGVRPKSQRHQQTFEWGRSNFLEEARTLARFEHSSIVRVLRVFEANSTAYMVMRFEEGPSFEAWLNGLGRLPTQEELDGIVAHLLSALETLHAADFLHRDIAPDNIIIRADGTPVLLDFGAARRAVAEMSRTLTGIVKAGYSPHEQYSANSRLQGPWSDFYALGGTLYRAVMGRPPEESALRVSDDRLVPASQAAKKGRYRPGFLAGIDACLRVRHAERPRSVAQLRAMMLAPTSVPKRGPQAARGSPRPTGRPASGRPVTRPPSASPPARRLALLAVGVGLLGGAYGAIEYMRWQPHGPAPAGTALDAGQRAAFVKRVQTVLKRGGCYDGAVSGRAGDAQAALDLFVAGAGRQGRTRPARIDLGKASAGEFESWLGDAERIEGEVCAPR